MGFIYSESVKTYRKSESCRIFFISMVLLACVSCPALVLAEQEALEDTSAMVTEQNLGSSSPEESIASGAGAGEDVIDSNQKSDANSFLPDEKIFSSLLADPREPIFSMRLAKYYTDEKDFTAAAVALGDSLAIYNFISEDDRKLQFVIDGGVFSLFDLDTESNDLRNTDFIAGLALAYRKKDWSARLRLSHLSSHLGDEYVVHNPDRRRDNPSYETAEFTLSYDCNSFRYYAEMGGIVRATESMKRLSVAGGLEYKHILKEPYLAFVFAAYLESKQDQEWGLNQSYFSGLALYGKNQRTIRVGAEFYNGTSPEGQFSDLKAYYWGLAFYFSP